MVVWRGMALVAARASTTSATMPYRRTLQLELLALAQQLDTGSAN